MEGLSDLALLAAMPDAVKRKILAQLQPQGQSSQEPQQGRAVAEAPNPSNPELDHAQQIQAQPGKSPETVAVTCSLPTPPKPVQLPLIKGSGGLVVVDGFLSGTNLQVLEL